MKMMCFGKQMWFQLGTGDPQISGSQQLLMD